MNQIAQALRRQGYKGALSDPNAVRAFMTTEQPMEFTDQNGNTLTVDQAVEYAAKKVTVSVSADAGEEVEVTGGKMAGGDEDEIGGDAEMEPKSAPKGKGKAKTIESVIVAPFVGKSGFTGSAKRSAYINRKSRFGVGGGDGQVAFDDADRAEAFGAWARKTILGNRPYPQAKADDEIIRKTQVTTDFTQSGALVPDDFKAELIEIVQEYGAARQVAGVTAMSRDVLEMPRLTADVTANWTGEAAAATSTDPSFDQVRLVASKLTTISKVSNELMNDSAVDVASILARSIARAHANKEDNAYFLGDGTSTYGGFRGVIGGLKSIGANPEDAAGLSLAAGDIWSEITQANIDAMFALLYEFSGIQSPVIVCHSKFYWNVLVKFLHRNEHVASAALVGGYPYSNNPGSRPPQTFYGYPVVFSNVMPTASTGTSARDTVPMLFGDFRLGSKFGEVSGALEIAQSEHSDFANDLVAIRSKNRVAINVHDIGDGTTPGPIVGLIMEDA